MDDLGTIANLSEIVGTVFVVGGVIFATIQIRQIQRQRKETAAIEMMRAWQDPGFSRSFYALATAASIDEENIERLFGPEQPLGKDAYIVFGLLESVGVMVYRDILTPEIAFDLLGGATIALWEKYFIWIERNRATNARAYEWFEWLYLDFVEREKNNGAPIPRSKDT